ncbi:hypothetical protein [Rhizobium sp. 18055]|nr:hypothetical protein [Rhizobium sp. 18055]
MTSTTEDLRIDYVEFNVTVLRQNASISPGKAPATNWLWTKS